MQTYAPMAPATGSPTTAVPDSKHPPPAPLPAPPISTSPSSALPHGSIARTHQSLAPAPFTSPVNQNGSFEFDRVIKSGYVQRRTQKTKTWRSIFLVLRPNALSIYKTDKEDKLRHQIFTSELTAVTFLRDPKQKRHNVFGLFSPSHNYYFQGPTPQDTHAWVDAIRTEARIEEEEEEMLTASPAMHLSFYGFPNPFRTRGNTHVHAKTTDRERFASSSPEPPPVATQAQHKLSSQQQHHIHSDAAYSGNELGLSDYSDYDGGAQLQPPPKATAALPVVPFSDNLAGGGRGMRCASQSSGLGGVGGLGASGSLLDTDPDRIIWQGWLWLLRGKGGVRQWKDSWAVLRPRNLILYKDGSEYAAQLIVPLSSIVNVVERDPLSRTKRYCLQIITEERNYRFAAHDEETLVQCLGAFKSLLAKRRGLELRAAAAAAAAAAEPDADAEDDAGVGKGDDPASPRSPSFIDAARVARTNARAAIPYAPMGSALAIPS